MISPKQLDTKVMTTKTVETTIGFFNFKLKDQDSNNIFFHKKNAIDENEEFDNMSSTVNFINTIKRLDGIGWKIIHSSLKMFLLLYIVVVFLHTLNTMIDIWKCFKCDHDPIRKVLKAKTVMIF